MKRLFIPVLYFFVGVAPSFAVVSSSVSSESPLYGYAERLEAHQCSGYGFLLARPQAYVELVEGVGGIDDRRCTAPEWLLRERQILSLPQAPNIGRVQARALAPDRLRLPGIEAFVDPAIPEKMGRPLYGQGNLFIELEAQADLRREIGFAFRAVPGWLGAVGTEPPALGRFYVYEAEAKVGYRRTDLSIARLAMEWGEGRHGNLLLSSGARPMDIFKFTVRPHIWADFAKFLGPMTFEAWWGSGSNDTQFVRGSQYASFAFGMRPAPQFSMGFQHVFMFNGEGHTAISPGDLPKLFFLSGDPALTQKRERLMALHLSGWPYKRNVKLYTSFLFDQLGPSHSWFEEDISWLLGLWLPHVAQGDLRIEWVRTAPRAFTSARWAQGFTLDRVPLGHPLGPDAEGIYIDFGLPPIHEVRGEMQIAIERRARTKLWASATDNRFSLGLTARRRWINWEGALTTRVSKASDANFMAGANETVTSLWGQVSYQFF